MVSNPAAEREVEAVLVDRQHPAYATMWKSVAERGYGKAVQPISGADGEGPLTIEITRRIIRPAPAAG